MGVLRLWAGSTSSTPAGAGRLRAELAPAEDLHFAGGAVGTVALGVLYAYWQEKSRSVVAPSISHNFSDGFEFAIEYAWVAFL